MDKIDVSSSLEQAIDKLSDVKLEINNRRVTLKEILASKNISTTEKDTLLILIQKVNSEFSLNKTELNTGKNKIATSITNKGVTADGTESLTSLSGKIDQIRVGAIFS